MFNCHLFQVAWVGKSEEDLKSEVKEVKLILIFDFGCLVCVILGKGNGSI